jgi:predicted transposase YdaD
MTEHEIAHPHDRLARFFLVDSELVADLLTHYVDSDVVSLLDLKRLRCESPINVDSNLAQVIGDIRYSTVFKKSPRQSNVFVFLEHQSTNDELMCFRALEQVVKAYREYIDNAKQKTKSFPCPVVVILYHGKRPWGTLKRMRDLIDSVPGFPKDLLDFPIFLIDLSQIPPEQLKGHPALVALLETLQLGSEGKLEAGFDRVTERLAAVRKDPRAAGWMTALVRYSLSICRIGQEAVVKAFTKILSQKEAEKMAMSTAQELILEGETRGKVKGKVEGKKEAILDVLESRFGKVPKTIRDTVNSYSDLTALKSLVVFAGSCKSLDEFKEWLR